MNYNNQSKPLGELYPRANETLLSPFLHSNTNPSDMEKLRIIIPGMYKDIVMLKLFTFALLILIVLICVYIK